MISCKAWKNVPLAQTSIHYSHSVLCTLYYLLSLRKKVDNLVVGQSKIL